MSHPSVSAPEGAGYQGRGSPASTLIEWCNVLHVPKDNDQMGSLPCAGAYSVFRVKRDEEAHSGRD